MAYGTSVGIAGRVLVTVKAGINSTGGSEQIVGSITLAAGSLGPLTATDVLDFSFSSVAGDPISFSLSGGTANVTCGEDCGLTASSSAWTSYETPPMGSNVLTELIQFGGSGTPNILALAFVSNAYDIQGVGYPYPGVDLFTTSAGFGEADGYALPIGTNIATAPVPLPASAWLMLSGLGGFGVMRKKRLR